MIKRSKSLVARPPRNELLRARLAKEAPLLLKTDQRRHWISRSIWLGSGFALVSIFAALMLFVHQRTFDLLPHTVRIEAALSDALGANSEISFEAAKLRVDLLGGVAHVDLDNPIAVISGQSAPIIASAIDVIVPLAPLLTGSVEAQQIQIDGVNLRFAVDLPTKSENAMPAMPREMVAIANVIGGQAERIFGVLLAQVEQIGIDNVSLTNSVISVVSPALAGAQISFSDVSLDGSGEGARLGVSGEFGFGEFASPIRLDANIRENGSLTRLAATIDPVPLHEILEPERLPLVVTTPVGATFDAGYGPGAFANDVTISLTLGAGEIGSKEKAHQRLNVRSADIAVAASGDTPGYQVERLFLDTNGGRLAGSGTMLPGLSEDDRSIWDLDLRFPDLSLDDQSGSDPIDFDVATLVGTIDPDQSLFLIDNVTLESDRVDISGKAEIQIREGDFRFRVDSEFSEMTVADLRHVWLPPIGAPARLWFREHVDRGDIGAGTLYIGRPFASEREPGRPPILTLIKTTVENATVRYFNTLPPLEVPAGTVVLNSEVFEARSDVGYLDLASGRRIDFTDGLVRLDGLGFPLPDMRTTAKLIADVPAFVEYMSLDGVISGDPLPFGPDDVSGTGTGDLELTMTIAPTEEQRALRYAVKGRVEALATDTVVPSRKLSNGTIEIDFSRESVALEGRVDVDGVTSDVELLQGLTSQALPNEGLAVEMRLSENEQAGFGLDLGDLVSGPIDVRLQQDGRARERTTIAIDLAPASLAFSPLGWAKSEGQPATASFSIPSTGNQNTLSNFEFDGPGLDLAGTVVLSGSGSGVDSANFSTFRMSAGDVASLQVNATDPNNPDIQLRGNRFDIRPIISAISGRRDGGDSGGVRVRATLDQAVGHNGVAINDLDLNFSQASGRISALEFSGQLDGRWRIDGRMNSPTQIRIDSSGAGALMRFLDYYDYGDGGALELRADQLAGAAGSWDGRLVITDFRSVGDPVLQRFTTRFEEEDLERASDQQSSENQGTVSFSKLRVNFNQNASELKIEDGTLKGPRIGTTFRGAVSRDTQALDISGTFVPAYGLNNAFRQVPILGAVLGGRQDEGLFGITYRVRGTTRAPEVEFNPLSAVAPGIFRRIFEFDTGDARALPLDDGIDQDAARRDN
ncbi:MAG: AsmA-like C-terminal region-containing protein [Pseudomonadota bacterium]